jgi:hypothetical protein
MSSTADGQRHLFEIPDDVAYFNLAPRGRVLELACGTGQCWASRPAIPTDYGALGGGARS